MSKHFKRLLDDPATPFVAIDFETANYFQDSACAVALIRVENRQIVDRRVTLLRPRSRWFSFSYLHGITYSKVQTAPSFRDAWPELSAILDGVGFLAAHNAGFDQGVLRQCCRVAGLPPPLQPFECTVKLSRKLWRLHSHKLPVVCSHLGIPLQHHDAASDAEACAQIVLAAAAAMRTRQQALAVQLPRDENSRV